MLQVVSVTQRTSHEDTLSGASQALTRYSVGSKRQQYVAGLGAGVAVPRLGRCYKGTVVWAQAQDEVCDS